MSFPRQQLKLGQEGNLSLSERNDFIVKINGGYTKAVAVNNFLVSQGSALADKLGPYLTEWNMNWNKAASLTSQIDQIYADLSSEDSTKWVWNVDRDTALSGWLAAVGNLYQIMQNVQNAPPAPSPTPGPSPEPSPTPEPAPAPTDTADDTLLYIIGGVGAAVLIGSAIYVFTR